MLSQRPFTKFCLLLSLFPIPGVLAKFSYASCCANASITQSLFVKDNITSLHTPVFGPYNTCNQEFNAGIPAAADVYVTYMHCKSNCSGFDLSKGDKPDAWAAPVVQFILPSLIFSMSIPRQRMFVPAWRPREDGKPKGGLTILSLLLYGPILILPTAIDTLIWVAVILTLAGPMMVAGLTEALLDFRILHALSQNKYSNRDGFPTTWLNDGSRLRLLVAVVCGNLELLDASYNNHSWYSKGPYKRVQLSADPLKEIPDVLEQESNKKYKKYKLLSLLSAQGDFGALVGAPVAFYLGGFVYTILDLLNDPSVQDAAISLAYGVEWMIVVHVAIISGCLLASNNPSAVSALGGLSDEPLGQDNQRWSSLVYETQFQPVSMQNRGNNKKAWLESIPVPDTRKVSEQKQQLLALESLQNDVYIGFWGYLGLIALPTFVLISLPPAAGAVVAWQTPPVGLGCRSLTLILYASCQSLLTIFHEIEYCTRSIKDPGPWKAVEKGKCWQWIWKVVGRACYFPVVLPVYLLSCICSLFTALGGTIMQVMGVYKNCFCYVNAPDWIHLDRAYVGIASDTLDQRNSSQNWLIMGVTATVFMALCSYVGWWFQSKIRTEYKKEVEKLDVGASGPNMQA